MGQAQQEISDALRSFIEAQRLFFVGTAPLGSDGHVNVSPKGLDSFRVLHSKQVAYLDYTGSGVETIAHIRENGRLTIMFCAFDGQPRIVRLYGRGRVVEPDDAEFAQLVTRFVPEGALRSIIVLDVSRVAESCGFGVPLFEFCGHRDQLVRWAQRKSPEEQRDYRRTKNAASIDGLAGLRSATPQ
jgi:hypothetical protein